MVDHQQPEQKGDAIKHPEEKQVRSERQAENKERGEVDSAIENYTGQIKSDNKEQKVRGQSKATGAGADAYGKGGLASAKDLLGDFAHDTLSKEAERKTISPERQAELMAEIQRDGYIVGKPKESHTHRGSAEDTGTVTDYKPQKLNEQSYSLGMNYQEGEAPPRDLGEKIGDFAAAAARRATDPQGWQTWFDGEVQKVCGIAEGLNEAKEETKTAVAAGFKALADGTVTDFLSRPNAINEPLFKTVANVFDAVSTDPNATNKALEALGNAVIKDSNDYSAMPKEEQGKVIGKTMFAMINPEGSTEGAEVALKIADKVATHVDKAVIDTISTSLKAAERASQQSPELAQHAKQRLLDYMNSKGLLGPKLQYEGIPDGYFEGMQPTRNAAKDNYMAMSNMDNAGERAVKKPDAAIENHPLSEKFFSNLKNIMESLSESQQKFLIDNGIEIKPVRRVSDYFTNSESRAACYDPSDKVMYVAQEVYSQGRWQAAENLSFDFKHELGHAINSKCGKFGEPLSETADFRAVFRQDAEHLTMELLGDLKIPTHSPYAMRDEIFADLYGHHCGEATSSYRSNQIRKLFPRCYEQLEKMRSQLP